MIPHDERALCYVAGPYMRPDPVENTNKAVMAGESLESSGLVTPFIPHLSLLWHAISPHSDPEHWYSVDLAYLNKCDVLLRIPGESVGADKEVDYANQNGIPVFFEEEDLLDWVRKNFDCED